MALIKCTECQKEVPDKAIACPHCGCPVDDMMLADVNVAGENKTAKESGKVKIALIAGIAGVVIIASFFLINFLYKEKPAHTGSGTSQMAGNNAGNAEKNEHEP